MVNSVNGDRGSSVIPLASNEDDYLFLGRGRHILINGTNVYMNGRSGILLENGIEASKTGKLSTIRSTANAMKLLLLEQIGDSDDYILKYGGYVIS